MAHQFAATDTAVIYGSSCVLDVDKDESLGSLSDKTDAFDTSIKREDEPGKAQDEMSWEAAKELLDAVEEFGNITGQSVACFLKYQCIVRRTSVRLHLLYTMDIYNYSCACMCVCVHV